MSIESVYETSGFELHFRSRCTAKADCGAFVAGAQP